MEPKQTMSLWMSAYDGDPWMVWDPSLVLTPEESRTLFWETYPTVRWELAPAFGNDVNKTLRHVPSECATWPPSEQDYSEWTAQQKLTERVSEAQSGFAKPSINN
jgi:hypothetical protein